MGLWYSKGMFYHMNISLWSTNFLAYDFSQFPFDWNIKQICKLLFNSSPLIMLDEKIKIKFGYVKYVLWPELWFKSWLAFLILLRFFTSCIFLILPFTNFADFVMFCDKKILLTKLVIFVVVEKKSRIILRISLIYKFRENSIWFVLIY